MKLFTLGIENSEQHFEGTLKEKLEPVVKILTKNAANGTLRVEENYEFDWDE